MSGNFLKSLLNHDDVFFIAEAGVNHNGSLSLARRLIDIAKDAGADCVKFQNFYAETLNLRNAPKAQYHVETTGSDSDGSWYDLLRSQEIDTVMLRGIVDYCDKKDILFSSTPYSEVNLLELLHYDIPFVKIASTDLTNLKFLSNLRDSGRSIILSTAMGDWAEVERAVSIFSDDHDLAILQCVGNYPADPSHSNVKVVETYAREFNRPVGLSDHSLSALPSILSIAMGASIIEKHFTYDRDAPGPDHRMSLLPNELGDTVSAVKSVKSILGDGVKRVLESEIDNKAKLQKSLVVLAGKAGDELTEENLSALRPGHGISASLYESYLGRVLVGDVDSPSLLTEEMLK